MAITRTIQDAAYTTIGAGVLAVQQAQQKAKELGGDLRERVEPVVGDVRQRVEPVVEQVKHAAERGAARARELVGRAA